MVAKSGVQVLRQLLVAFSFDQAVIWNFCCYLASEESGDFSFPRRALEPPIVLDGAQAEAVSLLSIQHLKQAERIHGASWEFYYCSYIEST